MTLKVSTATGTVCAVATSASCFAAAIIDFSVLLRSAITQVKLVL